jgi:hypothetical protein
MPLSRQSARLSLQSSALSPPLGCPPPPPLGSKGDTLAMGRGGGGSQFGRRDRHSGTLGIVLSNPSNAGHGFDFSVEILRDSVQ